MHSDFHLRVHTQFKDAALEISAKTHFLHIYMHYDTNILKYKVLIKKV